MVKGLVSSRPGLGMWVLRLWGYLYVPAINASLAFSNHSSLMPFKVWGVEPGVSMPGWLFSCVQALLRLSFDTSFSKRSRVAMGARSWPSMNLSVEANALSSGPS